MQCDSLVSCVVLFFLRPRVFLWNCVGELFGAEICWSRKNNSDVKLESRLPTNGEHCDMISSTVCISVCMYSVSETVVQNCLEQKFVGAENTTLMWRSSRGFRQTAGIELGHRPEVMYVCNDVISIIVCMHVSMYVCVYVCMYVCINCSGPYIPCHELHWMIILGGPGYVSASLLRIVWRLHELQTDPSAEVPTDPSALHGRHTP